jgi:hypothetical protein
LRLSVVGCACGDRVEDNTCDTRGGKMAPPSDGELEAVRRRPDDRFRFCGEAVADDGDEMTTMPPSESEASVRSEASLQTDDINIQRSAAPAQGPRLGCGAPPPPVGTGS